MSSPGMGSGGAVILCHTMPYLGIVEGEKRRKRRLEARLWEGRGWVRGRAGNHARGHPGLAGGHSRGMS